jgi:hypothetical protein
VAPKVSVEESTTTTNKLKSQIKSSQNNTKETYSNKTKQSSQNNNINKPKIENNSQKTLTPFKVKTGTVTEKTLAQKSTHNSVIKDRSQIINKWKSIQERNKNEKQSSSWDQITKDLKKKEKPKFNTNKSKKTKDNYYDELEEEEEDDEYDSELDDFIVDSDSEIETNAKKSNKNVSKCIQEIFKYNPKKFKHIDDDDDIDNMESSYTAQLREEKQR